MTTLSVETAGSQLPDIIHRLGPGEEVFITEGGQVVARLVREGAKGCQRPAPGLGKGMLTINADDDEHLRDFVELWDAADTMRTRDHAK
jgi:antitoxin (DNA-binding transcriptional repressor) of toxin-antitoxin stability system